MSKRDWRWISRNSRGYGVVYVYSSSKKPKACGSYGDIYYMGCDFICVCAKKFERLFGVSIKPGECVKVRFKKAEIIKDDTRKQKRVSR